MATSPAPFQDLQSYPVGTVILNPEAERFELLLRARKTGRLVWVGSRLASAAIIDTRTLVAQLLDVTHDYHATFVPVLGPDTDPVILRCYNDLSVTDDEADLLDASRRTVVGTFTDSLPGGALVLVYRRGRPVEAFHRLAGGWVSTTNACDTYATAELQEHLSSASWTAITPPV